MREQKKICLTYSKNLSEVCTNFSRSLYRLQLKSLESDMPPKS